MDLASLPSQVTTTALGVYVNDSGSPSEVLQTEVRGGGRQEDVNLRIEAPVKCVTPLHQASVLAKPPQVVPGLGRS